VESPKHWFFGFYWFFWFSQDFVNFLVHILFSTFLFRLLLSFSPLDLYLTLVLDMPHSGSGLVVVVVAVVSAVAVVITVVEVVL
jgi:hypothetical protein